MELFTFSLNLAGTLKALFFVVTGVFLIYSFFLIYHWRSYGVNKKTNFMASIFYLGGGVVILLIMAGAIYSIA